MVLHNPNNWHWVNKNVAEWARNYLEQNIEGISANENDVTAKITKLNSMDGDVDVSQRKGKVITLFDVKLVLAFEGTNKDADEASGTITIPEVAHDTELDEYVFDINITSDEKKAEPVKALIRKSIIPQLRTALSKLGPALIQEHGKDIQHAPGTGPPTGYSTTSKTVSSTAAQSKPSSSTSSGSKSGGVVNTVEVTDSTEFRTSAEELYTTFTDPQRIAAFTRSPPTVWDGAKSGGKFALFGGGVSGEYTDLEAPTKIVQKWRLSTWPEGYYSDLEIKFSQNDSQGTTMMKVRWSGVPVGEEDITKQKWGEYYVRALKTTFGFGTIL